MSDPYGALNCLLACSLLPLQRKVQIITLNPLGLAGWMQDYTIGMIA